MPLDLMLDNPLFTVHYDPKGNSGKNEETTMAYVYPGDAFNIFMVPLGCGSGPAHIAQDIAHEFAHLTLGHYGAWYQKLKAAQEKIEHDKARGVEVLCGFRIQNMTTITVTAQ